MPAVRRSSGPRLAVEQLETREVPAGLLADNQTFSVPENTAPGSAVGTVQNTAPGLGINYSITGGTGQGLFAINPTTGALAVATGASLNFEAAPSYTLNVSAVEQTAPAGQLLVFEPFDYQTATLNDADGGLGWNGNWGVRTTNNPADDQNGSFHKVAGTAAGGSNYTNSSGTVIGPPAVALNYPGGTAANLTATGGSAGRWQNAGGQFYERREFAATFGDSQGAVTRWMSFLIAPVMTIDHGGFSGLRLITTTPATASDGFVGWGGGANAWQVGAFSVGGTNATGKPGPEDADLAVGTNNDGQAAPTLLVVRMDFTGNASNDTLSLWVNPTAAQLAGPADAVYSDRNFGDFTGMYLQGNYGSVKDEIRIGTTLDTVIGAPAPRTGSTTVTVNLTDVNEAPTFSVAPPTFTLSENPALGAVVGTVQASDPDRGAQLTYAITGGNTGGAFAIGPGGQITVANPSAVNFEPTPSFALTIQAGDGGNPALTATITVAVNLIDVLEPTSPAAPQPATGGPGDNPLVPFAAGLPALPLPGASDDEVQVHALYHGILGRAADDSGLGAFTALLRRAGTQAVAAALWNSDEHRGLQVQRMYQSLLGRAADAGGLAGWVAALRAGLSEQQVLVGLLTSAEFLAQKSDAQAVAAMYDVLLGRSATDAEVQGQLFGSGGNLGAVANGVVGSDEAERVLFGDLYDVYLGRAASEGELAPRLAAPPAPLFDLVAGFLTADEFQQKIHVR